MSSPWATIWFHPKRTMQEVRTRPNRGLWVLSAICGFLFNLNLAVIYSFSTKLSFIVMLVLAVFLSVITGYLYFSISSFFVFIAGKCLKAKSTFLECRAALSWSSIPLVVNAVAWVFLLIAFKEKVFLDPSKAGFTAGQIYIVLTVSFLQVIFSVWSLVLYFYGLSEIQGFSISKAILNIILAVFFFLVLLLILWFIAVYLWAHYY